MSGKEELLEKIRQLEKENNRLAKELSIRRESELKLRPVVSAEMATKYGINSGSQHCHAIHMSGDQLITLGGIVRRALFGTKIVSRNHRGIQKESDATKRLCELLDEEYKQYLNVMDQILGILYENRKKEATA